MDKISLEFTDQACTSIAKQALARRSGARGLRSIVENILTDSMFELPSENGVDKVEINKEAVENGLSPHVVYKKKSRTK